MGPAKKPDVMYTGRVIENPAVSAPVSLVNPGTLRSLVSPGRSSTLGGPIRTGGRKTRAVCVRWKWLKRGESKTAWEVSDGEQTEPRCRYMTRQPQCPQTIVKKTGSVAEVQPDRSGVEEGFTQH